MPYECKTETFISGMSACHRPVEGTVNNTDIPASISYNKWQNSLRDVIPLAAHNTN
jgi:hypothetical protein